MVKQRQVVVSWQPLTLQSTELTHRLEKSAMTAENPQPDINPYASPRAMPTGPVPAEVMPFRLDGPIRAAGMLSPEDIRQGARLATAPHPPRFVWSLVAIFGCGFIAWDTASPSWLIPPALMLSFYLLAWLPYRWRARSAIQDTGHSRQEFSFSDNMVKSVSATVEAETDWQDFAKCTCSKTHVLLHRYGGDYLLVPRSFLAGDTDWQQFVAMVKHKLPEKEARPPHKPDPTWVSSCTDPEEAIRGQGHLTHGDMIVVYKQVAWQWRFRLLPFVALVITAAPLTVAIASGQWPSLAGLMAMLASLCGIAWLALIAPWQGLRKLERTRSDLVAVFALSVFEKGVKTVHRFGHSTLLWNHFAGFRELPEYLLLYYPSRSKVQILSRSCFAETDWPALVALVQRKLPRI